MTAPLFIFDIAQTWPETRATAKRNLGSSAECPDEVAAVTMAVAYMLSGRPLNTDVQNAYAKIIEFLGSVNVPEERVHAWAKSLLMPPSETLANLDAVPTHNLAFGFTYHPFQREGAGWAAHRRGSLLAYGCGVGKTGTATAAAVAAVHLGNSSNERCVIMCPVNAQSVWDKARADLDAVFKKVIIYSMDSAHHFASLDPGPGGALIIDEAHKAKGEDARRSKALRAMRRCFDWATCLTGSLLESGPEGLLALHDIACPGLSRFMCAMDFGKNFDCIAVTQLGRGTRRKLVIPGSKSAPFMVQYLARSTRSLSFESPEVAAVVHMEAHRDFVEDTWPRPAWAGLADPSILWCPDTGWQTYMGAMAVCMMHDDRDDMLTFAAKHGLAVALTAGGTAANVTPAHEEVAWQTLQAQFKALGKDPFFPAADGKEARRMALLGGLATFPRVMHASLREGRFARTIRKETDAATGTTYRWFYAPGHSRLNPGEGPKLTWVRDWLARNPKEQLVLGAGGKATVGACKILLEELGITYRVIEGGVPADHRGTFCEEFQAGAVRVMLLQQVAGSESVTLTAAATSVLLDHDLKATAYTQYRHRTYRQGQKRESEHFDHVFGPRQEALLALIQRGRSFDQTTRDKLEQEARNAGAKFG